MAKFIISTVGRIWREYEVHADSEEEALWADLSNANLLSSDEETESVEVVPD